MRYDITSGNDEGKFSLIVVSKTNPSKAKKPLRFTFCEEWVGAHCVTVGSFHRAYK